MKNKKNVKRITSLLLCLAMVLVFLDIPALAQGAMNNALCEECGNTEHLETCSSYVVPEEEEQVEEEVEKTTNSDEFDCNCDLEKDGTHAQACLDYFQKAYDHMMKANSVEKYGEMSSTLNEVETTYFRQWLKEQGLLEKFQEHTNKILYVEESSTFDIKREVSRSVADVSDAVKLAKSSTYNSSTGLYDITLESYTTGVVEEGEVLPADSVLVLDTSGSMAYDYKLSRVGTPMYGDYFHHSSGDYWGWLLDGHLLSDGTNPWVQLPDGSFARAKYLNTEYEKVGEYEKNHVEIFQVVDGSYKGTIFYPKMLNEEIVTVPRANNYPVLQLYSSIAEESYTVETGIPIFGSRFTYNSKYYYGWLGSNEGSPKVRMEDGTFVDAYYKSTDSKLVEIFAYKDSDTGKEFEFYPRLDEKYNGVTRQYKDLPIVQLYSGKTKQRMAALHDAVAEFLRLTAKNNEGLSVSAQSKVAIVQFSCDMHGGTAPTKILKNSTAITLDNVDAWISDVYKITDGGGSTHTEIGEGMLLAENIINGITRTSHKAVIAFTDGKPEGDGESGFSYTEANKAIATSKRLRDSYNADVYTVCIQEYANVNAGSALPPNDGKGVNQDRNNINRLMHLISSNYPNAESMTTPGTGSTSAGYYMVPGGEDDLVSIFSHIGDQIGSATIDLGATSYVLDYVSEYFEIPQGATVSLSVKDAYYENGTLKWKNSTMNTNKISYIVNNEDQTVRVTGFDYNHNFVANVGREEGNIANAGDFYGRKLVIKFSVEPKSDFLGGDDVKTNKDTSGIYSNGGIVSDFPVPEVDIELKSFNPEVVSKDIYLSQQASLPEVINIGMFKLAGDTEVHKVDGINNAYVDIKYVLKDKNGNELTYIIPAGTPFASLSGLHWESDDNIVTHPILTGDETYNVTCTVISKNDKTHIAPPSGQENLVDVNVRVFKPVVTFKDSAMALTEVADYGKNNLVSVAWKHGDELADEKVMGKAPELEYTYNPGAGAFTKDTPVTVTKVTAKKADVTGTNNVLAATPVDMDVTRYTTFYRNECDFNGCENNDGEKTYPTLVTNGGTNFKVHINTFDLVINKTLANVDVEDGESFVFNITNADTGYNNTVVIEGTGSVTVGALPVGGTYKVTEDTEWSWRYTPDATEKEVTINNSGVGEVNFTNTRSISQWLSGDSYLNNIFSGTTSKIKKLFNR